MLRACSIVIVASSLVNFHISLECLHNFLKRQRLLRAIVPKFRLEVCKMKKSKIPKLCQDIGLDELFLEKIL